jgi:DNA-binding PadR family transcriptional regulator
MKDTTGDAEKNPLELGSAYLDYCVKQGWLVKSGEGDAATYQVTPEGEKKLANVSINFDLSSVDKVDKEPRRKYRRRK